MQRTFYTENLLHRAAYSIFSSKTGSRHPNGKTRFRSTFQNDFLREIILAKMQKNLLPKHHSQPSRSHYSTIYDGALHKTIVLRTQSQQRSHSTAICRDRFAKRKRIMHTGYTNCDSKTKNLDAQAEKRQF